jgi:NAD(P)-dependent dehydrogenase (short-subunit alcohol dehydrogenase family)
VIAAPALEGKVALITGADGPLGSAIALRFAREGATVVLNDIVSRHLDRVAAEVVHVEGGGRALIALGDVTRPPHVERILREALDTFGRLDILVNNAGDDPETTVRCAALCAETVVPQMRERRWGRIVNVSSAGSIGTVGHVSAEAAHSGLIALTRKLALETAPHGLTVNCVVPGPTTAPAVSVPEAVQETMATLIPMGRIGEPREIAAALVFLASEESSYVTGQVLYVDGGLSGAA